MAFIDVEEALRIAMQREDNVRDAILALDKGFNNIRDAYCLPVDSSQWSSVHAARIVSNNKDYRLRVKQDMQVAAHNLKHLYSEGGDGDDRDHSTAMKVLLSMIVGAFEAKNLVGELLDEYASIYERLSDAGLLSLPDRVFTRKTRPDLERCRAHLARDAEKIRETFNTYKRVFCLLTYEHEFKDALAALKARKAVKTEIEMQTGPIFKILSTLLKERNDIHRQASQLGYDHATAWFSRTSERLPLSEFEQALAQYDALHERIRAQQPHFDVCVRVLMETEATAQSAPATLPGAYGKEVPVAKIWTAFTTYEEICANCKEMVELANPIIETLDEYLALLRQIDEQGALVALAQG